ncbi:MAG TPA: L-glutamate gamma-semialdehyde dehydrogenase [Bacteroidales bacterium]|nr:L-glutamate gamma-semialdehyde dehydrogenase [Bacteroidales bacterium]HPR57390.1 L-glutamate gamma-semialdehyde dehydrogenase [Bacteroidales bacterium]HRW96127.1 L-glutamate gamma-semialdehyde dehydrogenase [Bacteroidales bacterium]
MSKGFFSVSRPVNEPVLSYAPGTKERAEVKAMIAKMRSEIVDIPMFIGGDEIRTNDKREIRAPHEIKHLLGYYYQGEREHVVQAIDAALSVRRRWQDLPWYHRAGIFLKAADLVAGKYRAKINAATMLGQSKNIYQAEIDAACELADFLRFNVHFMKEIYEEQPVSSRGTWNYMEQRPLEGFVYAMTPFNFTSIAGNLPSSPAIMGNVVVWKPAATQVYSAAVIMEIFREAGLPPGVINMVNVNGPVGGKVMAEHPDFVGVHFTGSTEVFKKVWKAIGDNVMKHNTYPKIVGETGGKDFVMVHPTASPKQVATALSRGAFEYQGQKCSAASRAYIPKSLWKEVRELVKNDLNSFRMGGVEDFRNFINAVIDETAFDKISGYIFNAKRDGIEVVAGGNYDKSKGYFIEPTILRTDDPKYITMQEEIFGPVLSVYLYDDDKFEETLDLVNHTSPYALTGSIFATDRYAIELAFKKLENAAGNFYINDKPTGAIVGQQPFGGARASGTNDKSGSKLNLLRWVSPRSIKENFDPPTDYRYPFMDEE